MSLLKCPMWCPDLMCTMSPVILFFKDWSAELPSLNNWDRFSQMQKQRTELIRDVPRCSHAWLVIIHVGLTCSWYCRLLYDFIKLTPKSIELLAITETVPGQHGLTPCSPCQCGHIEMIGNLVQFIYKYKKHETYTRWSFNVNSDSIMGGFCVWGHELWDSPSPGNVYIFIFEKTLIIGGLK